MIDRDARNRLLQGIDDYMDEKISPDEFDFLLHNVIVPNTKDDVIQEIQYWLFESYQDIGTNCLQSHCPYWKFFNRLRLLLASDAECQIEWPHQRLLPFQWVGILGIISWIALAVVSICMQSLSVYLICGVPLYFLCGAVLFISLFFYKPEKTEPGFIFAQYPFESFAELLALRRSVPEFSSKRFPNKPPIPAPSLNRLIRFLWDTNCPAWVDRLGDTLISNFFYVYGALFVIAFWPLLVVLSFPLRNERQTRFVITDNKSTSS
jgi:hypothetical protein